MVDNRNIPEMVVRSTLVSPILVLVCSATTRMLPHTMQQMQLRQGCPLSTAASCSPFFVHLSGSKHNHSVSYAMLSLGSAFFVGN